MVCTVAIAISLAVITAGCTTSTNTPSPTPSVSTHVAAAVAQQRPASVSVRTAPMAVGGLVTYQNPIWGVKFNYPQDWWGAPYPQQNAQYRYYVCGPNNGDNFTVVAFWAWPNTGNDTLSNIVNNDTQTYSQYYGNVTVVKNVTSTTLGGMPALTQQLAGNYNNDPTTPTETLMTYTLHNGWVYVIRYDASPSYYAGSLNDVQQTINSFAFV